MEEKKVYLKTEHGYIFHAKLYNSDDYTYFGCKTWRALCKTYAFEPDMVITFDIRPEDDIEGNTVTPQKFNQDLVIKILPRV